MIHHNITGNGKCDGLKSIKIGQSAAKPLSNEEGSQIIPRKGSSESEKPNIYNAPLFSRHLTKQTNIPCVYRIYNVINNKSYIGETSSLQKRLRKHRRNLKTRRHNLPELFKDFDNYGKKFFRIEILSLDRTQEEYFIKKYNSVLNGYNQTINTNTNFKKDSKYYKFVLKEREKSYKPVLAFDLMGNFIREYKSVASCAKDLNDQTTNISEACKHENKVKRKEFVLIYKNNYNPNKSYKFDPNPKVISKSQKAKTSKANGTAIVINNIYYYSFNEAGKYLNYTGDQIRYAMKNKRSLAGLEMCYYEDMIEANRKLLERPCTDDLE